MGLTVIPTPGATPLHLDVRVSASTDAATKGYVDVADAADRAYAHSVATAAVRLGAAAAVVQSGSVATTTSGCRGFASAGSIMMDLAVPVGGSITGIIVRYLLGAPLLCV